MPDIITAHRLCHAGAVSCGAFTDDPSDPLSAENTKTLNYQTDEILDSLLSLSRFTKLVQWQYVQPEPSGPIYRPVRSFDSPQSIALKDSQGNPVPESQWIWTAASDGRTMVGWILRNFNYDGVESWKDTPSNLVPYAEIPRMDITGLDAGQTFELVWFDDRRGTIIARKAFSGPDLLNEKEAPTAGLSFGKSVAFLIQPYGMIPQASFAPLPNEHIGQILIDTSTSGDPVDLPAGWHAESAIIVHDQSYRYVCLTKPAINDPNKYYYRWDIAGDVTGDYGEDEVTHMIGSTGWQKVSVEIYPNDQCNEDERISGDTIYVQLW